MASQPYYTTPDRPRSVNPLPLAARRCIEEAWDDAKRFKDGEPTEDALNALMWILDTLDWTKLKGPDGSAIVPPPELRADFVFSFDWCCHLLETTPEKVRAVGLPSTRLFNQNSTVGGVAAIYEAWAEQRAAWLRKQASESDVTLEIPVSATCVPEAVGAAAFD